MSKRTVKIVRTPRLPFKVGVPVNVKVKGERSMRKSVVLERHDDPSFVVVHTGRRGRPAHLPVESIEKVRVL